MSVTECNDVQVGAYKAHDLFPSCTLYSRREPRMRVAVRLAGVRCQLSIALADYKTLDE